MNKEVACIIINKQAYEKEQLYLTNFFTGETIFFICKEYIKSS